jgi:hypothetical protein
MRPLQINQQHTKSGCTISKMSTTAPAGIQTATGTVQVRISPSDGSPAPAGLTAERVRAVALSSHGVTLSALDSSLYSAVHDADLESLLADDDFFVAGVLCAAVIVGTPAAIARPRVTALVANGAPMATVTTQAALATAIHERFAVAATPLAEASSEAAWVFEVQDDAAVAALAGKTTRLRAGGCASVVRFQPSPAAGAGAPAASLSPAAADAGAGAADGVIWEKSSTAAADGVTPAVASAAPAPIADAACDMNPTVIVDHAAVPAAAPRARITRMIVRHDAENCYIPSV